jgi:hypothetical protein
MFSRTWLARPKSHVCDAVETQVVNISVPDKSMDVLGQVRSFFCRVHRFPLHSIMFDATDSA